MQASRTASPGTSTPPRTSPRSAVGLPDEGSNQCRCLVEGVSFRGTRLNGPLDEPADQERRERRVLTLGRVGHVASDAEELRASGQVERGETSRVRPGAKLRRQLADRVAVTGCMGHYSTDLARCPGQLGSRDSQTRPLSWSAWPCATGV